MSDAGGDKKHVATERKRRQAREQGQVAKSQDLTSAALLLAGIAALYYFGQTAATVLAEGIQGTFSEPLVNDYDTRDATHQLARVGTRLAMATLPILCLMFIGAIVINVAQAGLVLSPAKLMPKLSNVSPLSGAKRIASLQGLMRLLFGLFKVSLIAGIAFLALRGQRDAVMGLAALSVPQIASKMFSMLVGVCLWIGSGLFVLALLEYVFQRWKTEQDMMMTDQELREELKDTD
ncbi:MAG: EscU/YscU/HrcU family type III secretion system export apparatus switch protein, partial [Planctomycetota bacterium]